MWVAEYQSSATVGGKIGGKYAESPTSRTSDGYFLQPGCGAMGLFVRHEFDAVVDANRDGQRERLGNGFGLSHWFWLSFEHPFRINN